MEFSSKFQSIVNKVIKRMDNNLVYGDEEKNMKLTNREDEHRKIFIERRAKEIRLKIEGGRIYGGEIDMENIDEVMVAAYTYAEMDGLGLLVRADKT